MGLLSLQALRRLPSLLPPCWLPAPLPRCPPACPQVLVDGFQHEQPDYWLNFGNPWELERLNVAYPISFYGHVSGGAWPRRLVCCWPDCCAAGLAAWVAQ